MMADSGVIITVIIGFIVSSIFFFSSFGFVDENHAFTIGGFGLFIGGIAGYIISVYVLIKGL